MAVHRLVVVGVVEQHEEAVFGILAQLVDGAAAGGADDAPAATAISMPGCASSLVPGADLAAGDVSGLVERPAPRNRESDGRAAGRIGHPGEDRRGHGEGGADGQGVADDVAADHLTHLCVP